VSVCRSGRVTYASRSAQRQLSRFFPPRRRLGARLPDDVARWLVASRAPASSGADLARLGLPLVVERDGVELEISALEDDDRSVLVLRERARRVAAPPLEALGLTPRQAEILAWLAQGKTNFEIATILAISPHTVARHVEAIFERLEVQTRTAAAAAAFARLASG
jgi:DNA-binding CsgD family transcriptional regulator